MAKRKIVSVPRSPLADAAPLQHAAAKQEVPAPLAKIILRGRGEDEAFLAAVKTALAPNVPTTPNSTTKVDKDSRLLWLGPDEWLLWTADGKRQKTIDALQKAVEGQHAAVVDVSDYYTVIRLSGKGAADILSHGCPLDLRDNAFPVGSCAQSHFRNAGILLYRHEDGYDVQIRWSFAQYLWDYFAEVGKLL